MKFKLLENTIYNLKSLIITSSCIPTTFSREKLCVNIWKMIGLRKIPNKPAETKILSRKIVQKETDFKINMHLLDGLSYMVHCWDAGLNGQKAE